MWPAAVAPTVAAVEGQAIAATENVAVVAVRGQDEFVALGNTRVAIETFALAQAAGFLLDYKVVQAGKKKVKGKIREKLANPVMFVMATTTRQG